ncbi:MAG: glycosyltransferase family 39 protein [Desulfobacterales bacterium]|nr:glycosyltransferase family 39 protein [Desulfobacterales bacterium]MDP6806683.1 glycosyltransferase family 39 protein [Desulfobacterales bacterium]
MSLTPKLGKRGYFSKVSLCDYRPLVLIVIAAILVRFVFFLILQPWDPEFVWEKIMVGDARHYHGLAVELIKKREYNSPTSQFRTPGYPIFISLIYTITGVKPWIVLLIQIVINTITLVLLYILGTQVTDRKTALIAAGLYALDPLAIYYSHAILTETLFSLLFLISILTLTHGITDKNLKFILTSGFLLGITTLVKPVTLYFPIIIVILFLLWPMLKRSFRIKGTICYILIFFLSLSPWMFRNYHKYGHFSLTSFQGRNLLHDNATATRKAKTGETYAKIRRDFFDIATSKGATEDGAPTFYNSKIYNEIAVDYLLNNINYYVPVHFRGMLLVFIDVGVIGICNYLGLKTKSLSVEFTTTYHTLGEMTKAFFSIKPTPELMVSLGFYILLLITYGCFFLGGIMMIRNGEYSYLLLTILLMLYFSGLPGVIGQARYRVPVIPFYLIASAIGIKGVFNFMRKRRQ